MNIVAYCDCVPGQPEKVNKAKRVVIADGNLCRDCGFYVTWKRERGTAVKKRKKTEYLEEHRVLLERENDHRY